MQVVEIPRTNNFWIDNGIVVLGKWLWDLGYKDGLELRSNKLVISNLTEAQFKEILNHELKEKYSKEIVGTRTRFKRFLNPLISQYTTGSLWVDVIFPKKNNTTCFFVTGPHPTRKDTLELIAQRFLFLI